MLSGCADSANVGDDGTDETDSTETGEQDPPSDTDTDAGGPVCGDGLVEADEACEPGDDTGLCTPDCQLNVCGDGHVFADDFEACDDGNDLDDDACTTACEPNVCGDGIIFYGVEGCDDGNDVAGDGCSNTCTPEQVTQIVAGATHTCALLHTGAVRCWGENTFGMLGYGHTDTIGDDEHPAAAGDIDMGGIAVQLSAGYYHTCALLDTGAVRCWGSNIVGQLGIPGQQDVGDDEVPSSVSEVDIGGKVVQITSGDAHNCALLDTGKVRCWGLNHRGQLGYGNTLDIGDDENPSLAGDVNLGLHAAVALSAGAYSTCAVLDNGAVRCWGSGNNGILGYGNLEHIGDDETPSTAGNVDVGGKATQVSIHLLHTCARLDTGEVRCWGLGTLSGHPWAKYTIGDDEPPTAVGTVDLGVGVVDVSTGQFHTCVVLDGGGVRCWGSADQGQLGYGSDEFIGDDEGPTSVGLVELGGSVTSLVTGDAHSCALVLDGSVRCWGSNEYGQLGLGHTQNIGDDELPTSADPIRVY
ncbi:Molybdopterin oxidoreductase, iron-sulfur binding subunit [Enhygromyxa salina]|uniref:Molybdopterin oxidoreductase, iron-sulfur binding subunit n=1 Tax=Enhygromyxa salina TaxID=215803 RepID=A0A0C2A0M0_9BACT|nr:Molybdopterin oxidoreductase, iron-sulfur binding subunit [Enhygromyxa salina]